MVINLNKLDHKIMCNEYSHRQRKTFMEKKYNIKIIIKNFFETLFSTLETIQ